MQNYYIFSEKTGTPVLDTSGTPLTWLDLMADLAAWAEAEGFRLETAQNEQGEDMFRIVEAGTVTSPEKPMMADANRGQVAGGVDDALRTRIQHRYVTGWKTGDE